MSETMKMLTAGMDALAAGLRSAARRCRRSAARQGTRGRRGARSVGPFGLPWAMYRQTMADVSVAIICGVTIASTALQLWRDSR